MALDTSITNFRNKGIDNPPMVFQISISMKYYLVVDTLDQYCEVTTTVRDLRVNPLDSSHFSA